MGLIVTETTLEFSTVLFLHTGKAKHVDLNKHVKHVSSVTLPCTSVTPADHRSESELIPSSPPPPTTYHTGVDVREQERERDGERERKRREKQSVQSDSERCFSKRCMWEGHAMRLSNTHFQCTYGSALMLCGSCRNKLGSFHANSMEYIYFTCMT